MPVALIRLLQGLCLIPTAALFVGLLTCRLQQACLGLAWPLPPEPDGHLSTELILASAPAITLFLLIAVSGLLRHARPVATLLLFSLCGTLAAYCAVCLLAGAYGNTWTPGEIFHELLLNHLTLLGLALLPGLMLSALLERISHPHH